MTPFRKKIIIIRALGYIIPLIAALIVIYGSTSYKYFIAIIIFGVHVLSNRMHKCPFCGKFINDRLKIDEMQYCPNCGEKLDI